MLLADWHWSLARAKTHESLVALCNEYFATWSPVDLDRLPERCRPYPVRSVDDIARMVHTLSDWLCASGGRSRQDVLVTDLLAFLFSAHDRALEIQPSSEPANDAEMSALPGEDPVAG